MGGRYNLMGMLGLQDRMSPTLKSVLGLTTQLTARVNQADQAIRRLEGTRTIRLTVVDGVSTQVARIERRIAQVSGSETAVAFGIGGNVAQLGQSQAARALEQQQRQAERLTQQTAKSQQREQMLFQKRAEQFLFRQSQIEGRAAQQQLNQQVRAQRVAELAQRRQQQQEARAAALIDRQRTRTLDLIGQGLTRVGKGFMSTISTAGSVAWRVLSAPVRMLGSIPGMLGLGGGIYGAASLIGSALDWSSSMEQAQIAFTTMLGSADKGKAFVDQLFGFAAKTPFEFPEVTQNARMLLAMGFNPDQNAPTWQGVMPWMTAIGEAVSALGAGQDVFQRTALAIGQIQSKGRLMGEELKQLTETGIPVVEILAEKLGMTKEEIQAGGRAAISSERALQALLSGITEKYGGGMQKQSESWKGLWTTLKDYAQMTFGGLGDGIRGKLQPELLRIADWFENNKKTVAAWRQRLITFGYSGAKALADAVEGAMQKIDRLLGSPGWATADFGGKFRLAWDALIGQPFADWWAGPGKKRVTEIAGDMGSFLGRNIAGAVQMAFGLGDSGSMVEAGMTAGGAFVKGFISEIEKVDWGEVFKTATVKHPVASGVVLNWLSGGALLTGAGSLLKMGGKALWGRLFPAAVSAGTATAAAGGGLTGTGLATSGLSSAPFFWAALATIGGVELDRLRNRWIDKEFEGWNPAYGGEEARQKALSRTKAWANILPPTLAGIVGTMPALVDQNGGWWNTIVQGWRQMTGAEQKPVGMGDLRRLEAQTVLRTEVTLKADISIKRTDNPDDLALAERVADLVSVKVGQVLENLG